MNVTGCQLLDGVPYGLDLADCSLINVNACTIMDTRKIKQMQAAVRWTGNGRASMMANNTIGRGTADALDIAAGADVKLQGNRLDA